MLLTLKNKIYFSSFFFICLPIIGIAQISIKKLSFGPIYSIEEFKWSSAGNIDGSNPNIMSELVWSGLKVVGAELIAQIRIGRINPRISIYKSFATDGSVVDTDYTRNNREGISYQQAFNSSRSTSRQISAQIPINQKECLLFGLFFSHQKLYIHHKIQNNSSYYNSYFPGIEILNEHHIYNIANLTFRIHSNIKISRYFANGNWILRYDLQQPKSFKHYSYNGDISLGLEVKKKINEHLLLSANLQTSFNKSLNGEDQVYYSNGNVGITQFNGVEGNKLMLGITVKKI